MTCSAWLFETTRQMGGVLCDKFGEGISTLGNGGDKTRPIQRLLTREASEMRLLSDVASDAAKGSVQRVLIGVDRVEVKLTNGERYAARLVPWLDLQWLVEALHKSKSRFGFLDETPSQGKKNFAKVIAVIAPIVYLGLAWLILNRAQTGPPSGGIGGSGRISSRRRKKSRTLFSFFRRGHSMSNTKEEEEEEEIQKGKGFCRVAGVDSAQRELAEIVEYLQRPERFISIGARCPRGVLLTGPPGSGKTLLAAATAEEAGVPFFSCSAAAFVEILVGRGAARVRDLFIKARTHAPSIVFIDEIDAVARSRSASSFSGGGSDEREQTLNQILTELDGFDEKFISSSKQQYKGPVILIAATNRPEILDSALTRPGRLDRIVSVPLPDRKGREAILRVHIKSVKTEPSLDLSQLATACPANFSGADLACVVNEAALLALRSRADCVHAHHFKLAIQKRIQAHHLL